MNQIYFPLLPGFAKQGIPCWIFLRGFASYAAFNILSFATSLMYNNPELKKN
jgi:hypothetical protein